MEKMIIIDSSDGGSKRDDYKKKLRSGQRVRAKRRPEQIRVRANARGVGSIETRKQLICLKECGI